LFYILQAIRRAVSTHGNGLNFIGTIQARGLNNMELSDRIIAAAIE
jgi:hypothetical protein